MQKKSLKRVSVVLILAMLLSLCFSATIQTSAIETSGDYVYAFSGDNSVILGYNGSEENLTIPTQLGGKDVSGISDAFSGCESLKTVTLPSTLSWISKPFVGCTNLEAIYIDSSNGNFTSIDGVLFNKASNKLVAYPNAKASEYVISEGVTNIESYAFASCVSLESVTMPDSVTKINQFAFKDCTSLKNVAFGSSITSIGEKTFYDCSALENLEIPDSVNSIETNALHGTKWLANQPDGIVYAGKVAYAYNGEMSENTTMTIKDGTTAIAGSAFRGLTNLIEVNIPDSVMTIGILAFRDCENMKSITIPASVENIGGGSLGYYTVDSKETEIEDFTIFGEPGSAAEEYASKNNFNFAKIGEEPSSSEATEPSTSATEPSTSYNFGDVNLDGIINVKDATFIQRIAVDGTGSNITEVQRKLADVNDDGVINVKDATCVLFYLVNRFGGAGKVGQPSSDGPVSDKDEANMTLIVADKVKEDARFAIWIACDSLDMLCVDAAENEDGTYSFSIPGIYQEGNTNLIIWRMPAESTKNEMQYSLNISNVISYDGTYDCITLTGYSSATDFRGYNYLAYKKSSLSETEPDTTTHKGTEPEETTAPSGAVFKSVGLIGTIDGKGNWDNESYELAYADGVWSITLEFTGGKNEFKARVNDDWSVSFGNGDSQGYGNFTDTLNGKYVISIADGADDKTALTITECVEPTE